MGSHTSVCVCRRQVHQSHAASVYIVYEDTGSHTTMYVSAGDKSIKLTPLASSVYQIKFTQLKAICKLLSKQVMLLQLPHCDLILLYVSASPAY